MLLLFIFSREIGNICTKTNAKRLKINVFKSDAIILMFIVHNNDMIFNSYHFLNSAFIAIS